MWYERKFNKSSTSYNMKKYPKSRTRYTDKIYYRSVCLTLGDPRTAHSSLVVYPTVAARSLSGVVNLGASLKSCSWYSGGL